MEVAMLVVQIVLAVELLLSTAVLSGVGIWLGLEVRRWSKRLPDLSGFSGEIDKLSKQVEAFREGQVRVAATQIASVKHLSAAVSSFEKQIFAAVPTAPAGVTSAPDMNPLSEIERMAEEEVVVRRNYTENPNAVNAGMV